MSRNEPNEETIGEKHQISVSLKQLDVDSPVSTGSATTTPSSEAREQKTWRTHLPPKAVKLLSVTEKQGPKSVIRCFGPSVVITLLVTTLAIAAITGFLGFIFLADASNATWHKIMVQGWATRVVSIPSLVLRTAIDFQAGIVVAMLAALALEAGSVLLPDAARVSQARAAKERPRKLLVPLLLGSRWSRDAWQRNIIIVPIALLTLLVMILQFSSTILLSDLGLGTLPSFPNRASSTECDMQWHFLPGTPRGSDENGWTTGLIAYSSDLPIKLTTWLRSTNLFPTFAEYSEPNTAEGIDDTGVLLRAFLPYSQPSSREMLRNYSGNGVVLDSRVSCQAPVLRDLKFETPDHVGSDYSAQEGDSTFNISTQESGYIQVSRLIGSFAPSREAQRVWTPPEPAGIPFNCSYLIADDINAICALARPPFPDQLGLQIGNRAGGIISEFANVTNPEVLNRAYKNYTTFLTWGMPFLIMKVESRYFLQNVAVFPNAPDFKLSYSNYTPVGNVNFNIERHGTWANITTRNGPANLSVSLCYTAFDTARLSINMFGKNNRSEPALHYRLDDDSYYTSPDLNIQLGNARPSNNSMRPSTVLSLEKKESWIASSDMARPWGLVPTVQAYSLLEPWVLFPGGFGGIFGNMSAVWSTSKSKSIREKVRGMISLGQANQTNVIIPDPSISYVFDSALETSGSVARAMSSLITTLSSLAYYDQMPQYDVPSDAEESFFITKLFPQSRAGFWTVIVLLAIHMTLVLCVAIAFGRYSKHTLLGNYWQSVAQLFCEDTEGILCSSTSTDNQIRAQLRSVNAGERRVTLDGDTQGGVYLVGMRE